MTKRDSEGDVDAGDQCNEQTSDIIPEPVEGLGASSEEDSARDGAFSYSAEWHSFVHGFYAGMRTIKSRPRELPDIEDVQKEPAYYKGAYVLGTLVQLGILAGVSYLGYSGGILP